MVKEQLGHFKTLKVTSLEELVDRSVKDIPESDLTIQTDTHLVQMEYKEFEGDKKKFTIKPGCFIMTETNMGMILEKFQLREYNLLKTIDNTSAIIAEKDKFFNKLDVYKRLGKTDPKRAILIASPPGVGKTAAINDVCKAILKEEGSTVIQWDTSEIKACSVNKFFLNRSQFSKDVKKLILIIEDVEGGTSEEDYSARGVNSSLLNLLDGVGSPFKGVPTFIIATTNNPERTVGALIDRPGRFDKVLEMKTPSEEECRLLFAFIMKADELNDSEKRAAMKAHKGKFSIAHIEEAVIRSLLDDITVEEAVDELLAHKKRFKEAFMDTNKNGIGLG